MAKQYTYFRKPNGEPYRGTDGKYAPINLLSEIGKMATLNAEDIIQWTDFSIIKFEVALRSALVVLDSAEQELNESDAWSIVREALTAVVKKAPGKPINPTALIGESDKIAAAFYRKSPTKYVLVSSLSVANLPAQNINVQSCSVSALNSRQNRFPLPATLGVHGHASPFSDHLRSSRYQLVKVTTEARSIHQAADNALNSLNLLRGLWSLFATFGSSTMRFGSPFRKPIGVIHTGPIHTLHFADGRPVDDDLYWYEPTFTQEQELFK